MARVFPFQHSATGAVAYGPGIAQALGNQRVLKKLGRVALVTDQGVRGAGLTDRVLPGLGDKVAFIDDEVVPDASCAHIDALAARMASEGVEGVVALGGGSVIDTAKAAAAAVAKGCKIAELEGFATVRTRLMPVVAVPTTAGTGAESTQFVVVKDLSSGKKIILADTSLVPALGVLDPELVEKLPRPITAASGVDALTHAVEALVSRMANPIGDAWALSAIRMILAEGALERCLEEPGDVEARGQMLIAANLAGQAINTSMLGACHAFAHALGAMRGVPHGVANGMFLVATMRLNLEKARGRYALMGRALGGTGTDQALAELAVDRVEQLVHGKAGIPRRLSEVGVAEADLDVLTGLVLADPDLGTNPVQLSEPGQVRAVLTAQL